MKFTQKRYSPEELKRRKARLMAVRHLGPLAMIRKHRDRHDRLADRKALIKAAAEAGVFVPVADFE